MHGTESIKKGVLAAKSSVYKLVNNNKFAGWIKPRSEPTAQVAMMA